MKLSRHIVVICLTALMTLLFSCGEASVNPSSQAQSSTDSTSGTSEDKEASIEKEKEILKEMSDAASSQSASSEDSSTSSATEDKPETTSPASTTPAPTAPATKPTVPKPATPAPAAKPEAPSPSTVRVPVASGSHVLSGNGAVIDVSNQSNGYIMAKCSGTSKKIKLQIKTSKMTYNYDLNHNGNYEVFPLQMGNGTYTARVMENVSGSSYSQLYASSFNVGLSSSLMPFLYPNQYVNFNSSSAVVAKASSVCAGCTDDIDKLKAIYSYITNNIKYDYSKAKTVKSGYLPNVDSVLSSRKGICFDYSSLMASMLRSQNIPTKLVIGSVEAVAQNHAWNEVYLKGTGWITVKIQNTSTGWKLLDPTFGDKTANVGSYAAARCY